MTRRDFLERIGAVSVVGPLAGRALPVAPIITFVPHEIDFEGVEAAYHRTDLFERKRFEEFRLGDTIKVRLPQRYQP